MTCQSVMHPSMAEYWHIGAMTMRLRSSRPPTRSGVNNFALLMERLGSDQLLHGAIRFADGVAVIRCAGEIGIRKSNATVRSIAQDVARRRLAVDAEEEPRLRIHIGVTPAIENDPFAWKDLYASRSALRHSAFTDFGTAFIRQTMGMVGSGPNAS